MRAIVVSRFGGPEVLEIAERDDLRPGPGQVVVDVTAAGVNFMDIYQRSGSPNYSDDLPFIPGAEGAGTVAAIGERVTGLAVGDRVAWTGIPGSYAEQVALPAERSVPIPDGIDTQVAAATMLQGLTAHYLTSSSYAVQRGDVVVVHAAAGGVGLFLTQIVKLRGGIVVATTSSDDKAKLATEAGADHVASYDDFADVVRDVTDGAGAAAVYDGVGQATFDASLSAVRRRGILVLYGAASGPVPPLDTSRLMTGGSLYLTRPTLGHFIATREELLQRTDELFGWIGHGRLQVRVGATYPLGDAGRAHEDLAGRRTTGKLLLLPS